ncbi:MAG: tetratricopeptide repeat protein [Caulobacteraceae bacterium]|nr:tetratricopeptide repeat protein [Caulobacter sp.]
MALYAALLFGAALATHRPVARDLTCHDLYNSSLADIEDKRYDRALEKLGRVRAEIPGNAETYFAMGNAYVGKEDYQQAALCYRRVIALDPRHHRAYNNLAVIAYQQKLLQPAEHLLSTSLAIESGDAKTNYLLACVRRDLGDREGARGPAAEALRLRPDLEEYRKLNEELSAPAPTTAIHTASTNSTAAFDRFP